jgi:hypothetical protein
VSITIFPDRVAGNTGALRICSTGGLTKGWLLEKGSIAFYALSGDVSWERVVNRLHKPVAGLNHPASAVRAARSRGYAQAFSCNPLLDGLKQDLQAVATELWELILNEPPWCANDTSPARGPGPHRSAPHPRWSGGGATWARRGDRGAVPGETGDARDARSFEGFADDQFVALHAVEFLEDFSADIAIPSFTCIWYTCSDKARRWSEVS